MLAAKKEFINNNVDLLKNMLLGLEEAVKAFHSSPDMENKIATEFGLQLEDAKAWYSAVKIVGSPNISEASITRAINALYETKAISTKDVKVSDLIDGVLGVIV